MDFVVMDSAGLEPGQRLHLGDYRPKLCNRLLPTGLPRPALIE
jgi:hypothetical protein